MPLPDLAVEIWHAILNESIALPTFLDADCLPEVINPFFVFQDADEQCDNYPGYWETERCRNALRRVCKSWAAYLLRFEYRYVEIHDVLHNRVPREALGKAIRIRYRACSASWMDPCSTCYDPNLSSSISSTYVERLSTLIVDDRGNSSSAIRDLLVLMHTNMPQLQAILSRNSHYSKMSGRWTPSPASCSELKVARFGSWEQWTGVVGNTVVAISLPTYYQPIFADLERYSFPALRHFRIDDFSLKRGVVDGILSLLKKIGSNIKSLQLWSGVYHRKMPKELWEVCPRLERLDCTLDITHAPPESHPLHTMSFFTPSYDGYGKLRPPFYPDLKDFRSIRRLITQNSWIDIKESVSVNVDARSWFRTLVNACFLQGVSLEDYTGVLLEDGEIQSLLDIQ